MSDPTGAGLTVGMVGLGAMGNRMASRLIDAGYEVLLWNRTASKIAPLEARGGVAGASPAEVARRSAVTITMVTDPQALNSVVSGASGIAAGANAGMTLVEMSTVGPSAIARVQSMLPEGVDMLDAPVLGSLAEAARGALQVFVGGSAALFGRWQPLLAHLGTPVHVGPLGCGAAAKLVANSTLFGAIAVLGEALALGLGLGMERDAIFDVLATTPIAAQAARRRAAIESGDYPRRYPLALARKDAALIAEAALEAGADMRAIAAAASWLSDSRQISGEDPDYATVLEAILSRVHPADTGPQ